MKLRKALCLLLTIALILSIGMPGALAMEADGDDTAPETTEVTVSDEAPDETGEEATTAATTEAATEVADETTDSATEKATTEPDSSESSGDSSDTADVTVGDTIWIKSGAQTYKQPDTDSENRAVLFNYQTRILAVVTDADGNLYYEFEPSGLLQMFSDYKYVRVDSTSVEEPAESGEAGKEHDCTCGKGVSEELPNHDETCHRKQYVLGLIKNENSEYKTAAEIYANWGTYDNATQTDILNMVQVYVPTEYDALVELIEADSAEDDPGEVAIRELTALEESYASVTEDNCEEFYENMMSAYGKAFENDVVIVSTEQLKEIDAKFGALQEALYADFGYTHVQSLAAWPAVLSNYGTSVNSNDADGDVILNKTVSVGEEGISDFLLTLESYVTGTSMDYTIPVDLILVLDQSASMYAPMGLSSGLNNKVLYTDNSSNLTRYALDADKTSAVTGCKNLKAELSSDEVDSTGLTFREKCSQLGYLVAQSRSDGTAYCKVDHNHSENCKTYDWFVVQYVENDPNGEVWHFHRIEHTACPSTDKWHNRSYEDDCVKYTEEKLSDSHFYFYKSQTGALYDGITSFAKVLKDSGGDHRLAIAGFSGYDLAGDDSKNPNKPGTGIYVNGEKIAYDNTYQKQDSTYYSTITQDQYASALMSVKNNYSGIQASLAAVKTDYYGTYQDVGFDMALNIIENATKVDTDLEEYNREKIVVLFTDGEPSGPQKGDIVAKAKKVKDAGAKVYTICTSTLGAENREFLTVSSSDYPEANGTFGTANYTKGAQIPNPKYAKTAENTVELVRQFISIAKDVGGANIELDEKAILLDAISQYFTLPEELIKTIDSEGKPDATTLAKYIKVYTADYDGTSFGEENDFADANVVISQGEDGRYSMIRVTNFDYSENFVSTNGRGENDFHGRKLIVKIAINSDSRFLGGNNVVTNGTASGIYDGNGSKIAGFPVPEANVQIKQNDAEMESNVYLGGYYSKTITSDQIKDNTEITIGGVTLDLSKEDYGLEAWQIEYVTVEVTITGEDGKTFTLQELTEDMKYTVTVTIKPKGEAKDTSAGTPNDTEGKNSDLTNTIHVFKPELTFADSEVWYGGDEPTEYASNLTQKRWINDAGTASTDRGVTMLGDEPDLTLTYTPDATKIKENKIATKQDIPVEVTVKIGNWDVTDYVTFKHTDCTDDETVPENKEFLLHVKTCSLTITKQAATGTTIGDNEYFVFNVKKDGQPYTQVTIKGADSVTIYELPVGTYTVEEDASTAWRYTSSMASSSATLSKNNTSGTITCTNTKTNDQWLNHFNRVINVFGQATPNPDYQN